MRWLKRDMWKAGIALTGLLLFLVFMLWMPVSAAGAFEGTSVLPTPTPTTVQSTPTEDATVTALNKEKLIRDIQQLKNQNEQFKNQNAPDFFVWFPVLLRTNAAILFSTLVVVIGGLIGLFRWFGDRRGEREKRAEERFQAAVTGLGDEKEGAKIGAAILLRTFLRRGYEQFYTQTFDLAVAHLRLRTSPPSEDPDGMHQSQVEPNRDTSNTPLPLTPLRQALIVAFKEAFPLARSLDQETNESLNAASIQLDNAFLTMANLEWAWMPDASLREAKLLQTNLSGAFLLQADLSEAKLNEAKLSGAKLFWANLSAADLNNADLTGVRNLENARSLKNTNLRFVRGWTRDQLKALPNAKDAIIDEDTTTSPSQPPAVPSPPSQSNDAQAPSVPPAQVSTPTPGTGGSNTPSPEPSNGTQAQSAPPVQEGRPIADTGGSNAPSSSKPDPES